MSKEPGSRKPRVLMVVNADWYFENHWAHLASALAEGGFNVVVAAGVERGVRGGSTRPGYTFVPISLRRKARMPTAEVRSLVELSLLYGRERPDLVHHFTIKPVVYGSIAARLAGVKAVVNTIPGLGFMFVGVGLGGWLRKRIASSLYRLALAGERTRVVFLNPDDRDYFIDRGLVSARAARVIAGPGIRLGDFVPSREMAEPPVVLMAGRLLWDKGVGELVDAVRELRRQGEQCRLILAGSPDPANPRSVEERHIRRWEAEGIVEWLGWREDMPEVLRGATIVALPSYREGLGRILVEAGAMGRPVVATDVPGCRLVVRHGENGLLVPPRDVARLADALRVLLRDQGLRQCMGARGRQIVEAEFTEERVVEQTLALYRELLGAGVPTCSPAGAV